MRLLKSMLLFLMLLISTPIFALGKITLILDWFMNPDHAPIFVAQEKGFFAKQGLSVDIINPADPASPPKLVAADKATLAVTYQPTLLMANAEGLPLVRIATLVATPLNCLMVLKGGPISHIADLKGKTIGYTAGGADELMLKTLLKTADLTMADVNLVNVHYNLTQALLTHRVDAVSSVMRNVELYELKEAHQDGITFFPEEYGFPSYDELIIVANKNHLQDPNLKKFIRGLNEGVQYLVNHPESTWQLFAKKYPELNNQLNHASWLATVRRFSLTPAALDSSRYEILAKFMYDNGAISQIRPVSDYAISLSYT